MRRAYDKFRKSYEIILQQSVVYDYLNGDIIFVKISNLVDISNTLRSQIVVCVSAFDSFIHEIVKIGMLEIFQGLRSETPHYNKFDIPLELARKMINSPQKIDLLEKEIELRHSWKSFQKSDKVAEAIRIISIVELWKEVGKRMNMKPNEVSNKLDTIVKRRDSIAHEADLDNNGELKYIDKDLVEDYTIFINRLVINIYNALISEAS